MNKSLAYESVLHQEFGPQLRQVDEIYRSSLQAHLLAELPFSEFSYSARGRVLS